MTLDDGGSVLPLYAVLVEEQVNRELTGHRDQRYLSPPQPLESALALAALLGAGRLSSVGQAKVAIAGGRRTVTIHSVEGSA
jgi:hypothetical protein